MLRLLLMCWCPPATGCCLTSAHCPPLSPLLLLLLPPPQDLAKQDEELHVQGLAATGLQQLQQMRHAGSIITDAPDATSSDNNAEQQQAAASSTADVVVAAASSDSNGQPQAADGSQQQQASGVNPARRALLTRKLHHL